MATNPIELSITIKDALGVSASMVLYGRVDTTVTVADLNTAAESMLVTVSGLTDGAIVAAHVRVIQDVSGFGNPGTDSEVEKGGLFNLSQGASPYKQGFWVPALKDSIIVAGKVNIVDTAVAAFITALTTTGGTIDWTSKFQNLLIKLIDALVAFRKYRRQESRRSTTVNEA